MPPDVTEPDAVPLLGRGRLARLWLRAGHARSVLFLVLGSTWDALTLTRIDRWSDQALLAGYQVALVVLVTLQLRMDSGRPVPAAVRRHPWEGVSSSVRGCSCGRRRGWPCHPCSRFRAASPDPSPRNRASNRHSSSLACSLSVMGVFTTRLQRGRNATVHNAD